MDDELDDIWFDALDHDINNPNGAVLEPMDDQEAEEIIEQGKNTHKGPLGRTYRCMHALEEFDDAEIARRLVAVIDMMAVMGFDVVTLLFFLSWNLVIPPDMVHEQSVIR